MRDGTRRYATLYGGGGVFQAGLWCYDRAPRLHTDGRFGFEALPFERHAYVAYWTNVPSWPSGYYARGGERPVITRRGRATGYYARGGATDCCEGENTHGFLTPSTGSAWFLAWGQKHCMTSVKTRPIREVWEYLSEYPIVCDVVPGGPRGTQNREGVYLNRGHDLYDPPPRCRSSRTRSTLSPWGACRSTPLG